MINAVPAPVGALADATVAVIGMDDLQTALPFMSSKAEGSPLGVSVTASVDSFQVEQGRQKVGWPLHKMGHDRPQLPCAVDATCTNLTGEVAYP